MSPRPTASAPTVQGSASVGEDLPWDEQLPWVEVGAARRRRTPAPLPTPASGPLVPTAALAPTPVDSPAVHEPGHGIERGLRPPTGRPAVAPGGRASALTPTAEEPPVWAATAAGTEVEPRQERRGRRGGGLSTAVDLIDPHLRHHHWSVLGAGALLVAGIWALAVAPLALDRALQPPHREGALVLGGLIVLYALIATLRASLLERAGVRAASELRSRLLAHLHRHGGGTGDPVPATRFTHDVAAVRDLVVRTLPSLATGVLALIALLVVLVRSAPQVALLVAATATAYVLVMLLGRRLVGTREQRAAEQEHALAHVTAELLGAAGTIRAYGLEQRADDDLATAGRRADAARASARRTRALAGLVGALVAAAGVVLGLLMGEERVLTLGAVVLGVVLMHRALGRLGDLPAASAAGVRLRALLEQSGGSEEHPDAQPLGRLDGEVALRGLTLADPRLDAVSAHIPAGQHVVLLDRDGSHSAAVLACLTRATSPEAGQVLLDGQDVSHAPIADVRGHLAVVGSEPALLTGTVRETIRAGRPNASDDEVTRAARTAGADDLIVMLADGYETVLDPADPGLSDGQLRRIAIARALLREAPIVLLDGAEEGLDGAELEQVREALEALTAGRTALVRSRDPRTVLAADRVLWLDGGEIVEDGAPQHLAEDPDSHLSTWLHERA